METTNRDKIKIIEAAFGGPAKAAQAAGVAYTTWYRWKMSNGDVDKRTEKTLDLMLGSDVVKAFRIVAANL